MSPSRRCSKPSCARPAVSTLTYVYADSTAVLGPLATYAEPHCYDLCQVHSERMTVPRGWEVVRLEPDPDALRPSSDDLEALAKVTAFPLAPLEDILNMESGRLPWGSTIVVVSAIFTPELLATLVRMRDAGHRLAVAAVGGAAPQLRHAVSAGSKVVPQYGQRVQSAMGSGSRSEWERGYGRGRMLPLTRPATASPPSASPAAGSRRTAAAPSR